MRNAILKTRWALPASCTGTPGMLCFVSTVSWKLNWGNQVTAGILQMFCRWNFWPWLTSHAQQSLLLNLKPSRFWKISSCSSCEWGEQQWCTSLYQTVKLLRSHSFTPCGEGNKAECCKPTLYNMHNCVYLIHTSCTNTNSYAYRWHFTRKVKHKCVMAILLSRFPGTATFELFFRLPEIWLTNGRRWCVFFLYLFFKNASCSVTSNTLGKIFAIVCIDLPI